MIRLKRQRYDVVRVTTDSDGVVAVEVVHGDQTHKSADRDAADMNAYHALWELLWGKRLPVRYEARPTPDGTEV